MCLRVLMIVRVLVRARVPYWFTDIRLKINRNTRRLCLTKTVMMMMMMMIGDCSNVDDD